MRREFEEMNGMGGGMSEWDLVEEKWKDEQRDVFDEA
jgi:hypothetical protein